MLSLHLGVACFISAELTIIILAHALRRYSLAHAYDSSHAQFCLCKHFAIELYNNCTHNPEEKPKEKGRVFLRRR